MLFQMEFFFLRSSSPCEHVHCTGDLQHTRSGSLTTFTHLFQTHAQKIFQVCTLNGLCKHSSIFLPFKQKATIRNFVCFFFKCFYPILLHYIQYAFGWIFRYAALFTNSFIVHKSRRASSVPFLMASSIFLCTTVQRLKCSLTVLTTRIIQNWWMFSVLHVLILLPSVSEICILYVSAQPLPLTIRPCSNIQRTRK